MNSNKYVIRLEKECDYLSVETLVRESFWNVYRPGAVEHYVLKELRSNCDFVSDLDFIMEIDGEIIGQIVFVRAEIAVDDGDDLPIMTVGPICIAKKYQRMGYGKILLDYGLEKAKAYGCGAVCFEGNIDFYGKSGFITASSRGIRYHGLPEGMDDSFFLCKELTEGYFDGITGEYATPACYFVVDENPKDFEDYEAEFPYMEKLVLPGQLSF